MFPRSLTAAKEQKMNEKLKTYLTGRRNALSMRLAEDALAKADKENRIVPMVFAAPYYVMRWYGILVLGFKEECVRLERWKQGAPYCMDHNLGDQRGIIESGYLSSVLGGNVRFSENPPGEYLYKDVLGKIRPYTSVGFDIHKIREIPVEEMSDELKNLCIKNECKAFACDEPGAWEPLEGSSVPLGANPTVGVDYTSLLDGEELLSIIKMSNEFEIGKLPKVFAEKYHAEIVELSKQFAPEKLHSQFSEQFGLQNSKPTITIPKKEATMPEVVEKTPEQLAQERAAKKVRFEKIGEKYVSRVGGREVVNEVINEALELDKDASYVRGALGILIRDTDPIEQPASLLQLNDKQKKQYNILGAIRHQIDGSKFGGFEAELSQEVSKRVKDEETGATIGEPMHGGLHLPYDIRQRKVTFQEELSSLCQKFGIRSNFDLNVGTATAGGNLVGTQIRPQDFVEYLYNQLIQGFTYLRGLNGNIEIPKMTGGSTIYSAATEGAAPTESAPTFGQIDMAPKEVSGYVDMTRKLVIQSSLDVQNLVAMDLFKQLALKMNYLALFGSGSNGEPTGIFNTSGIGTFTGAAITWDQLLEARSDIGSANIVGELQWLMNAVSEVLLMGRPKNPTLSHGYLMESDGRLAGYGKQISEQIPAGYLALMKMAEVIFGEWGTVELFYNRAALSPTGGYRIEIYDMFDVALRYPGAVSYTSNLS